MASVTRLGGVPASATVSPLLLFQKFHRYDDPNDNSFERKTSMLPFLEDVAEASYSAWTELYPSWHRRFALACEALGGRSLRARTDWRLVVGWATNPALEVGLELDRLLGFPFVPGSAVKGLLHHVAELELTEVDLVEPSEDEPLPTEPPQTLRAVTDRALRVWLLFGSLAARRPGHPDLASEAPEPPIERLSAWRERLALENRATLSEAWCALLEDLERVTASHTGGLVSCFDAVPAPQPSRLPRRLLEVDVLTPHRAQTVGGKDGPNPTLFLAVRPGVDFEVRFRLRWLPTSSTVAETSTDDESTAQRILGNSSRVELEEQIMCWLIRGLEERGLGAKTSAGHGILRAGPAPRAPERPIRPARPAPSAEPELPATELYARAILPDDLDRSQVANALQRAIEEGTADELQAVSRRFAATYPETLDQWRQRGKPAVRKRLKKLGLLEEPSDDS